MNKNLDKILKRVQKASRYTGGELNSVVKNPEDVSIRYAFAFPDTYEVGMSHLGIKILYHILTSRATRQALSQIRLCGSMQII